MSLQRVFESARKMGVPVIVTDPAGREPMVVLPLEQFEAMTGEQETRRPSPAVSRQTPNEILRNDPFVSTPSLVDEFKLHTAQKEVSQPRNVDIPFESELPVEERFFLEPMDDSGA